MYDLLSGIRVLDVSFATPARVGAWLAELGADVIKVEEPPDGDRVRLLPGPFPQHLRENRGKRSLTLSLKAPEGRDLFLQLSKKVDVVIDGLRYGAMEGWGLGYQEVSAVNPKIVYCSISGYGLTGPYCTLGSHGFGYDGFAGIIPIERREDGMPYIGRWTVIGSTAGPLFATLGLCAALVKVQRTGQGQHLDVAQLDAAATWRDPEITGVINGGGWQKPMGRQNWVRYQFYDCKDGKVIQFEPFEWKFFENFARGVNRLDLLDLSKSKDRRPGGLDFETGNEVLRKEIAAIMKTKTLDEWLSFCIENDIPAVPAYEDPQDMIEDPQFKARENVITVQNPDIGTFHQLTSPIKLPGQTFEVLPAPRAGQHTIEVLKKMLDLDDARIAQLDKEGVITVKPVKPPFAKG